MGIPNQGISFSRCIVTVDKSLQTVPFSVYIFNIPDLAILYFRSPSLDFTERQMQAIGGRRARSFGRGSFPSFSLRNRVLGFLALEEGKETADDLDNRVHNREAAQKEGQLRYCS